MAIVFVSPKEKQKMLAIVIIIIFALLLTAIGLAVFFAKPKPVPFQRVFVAPKIEINFDILQSDQIARLEIPPAIQKEFNYEAYNKNDKKKTMIKGKVTAASQDQATEILTNMNLIITKIEETKQGRENPFTPFYNLNPPKTTK